jgi:transcriptional regulator of acetoin/glycerol metabolism
VIRRSWLRCSSAGLPSDRLRDIARLEDHRLLAELERHGDLIAAAEPVMDMLHLQLEHTGAIVLLCAPDGLILRSMGDPTFVPRAERVALEPGVSWTEERKGTNGIGTAIFEREPVVVYAAQHYVERNQFLSCSGTPVFHPTGDLAAVLDITGDYRSHHSQTLALARMASRNIERQLFLRHHREDLVMQVHGNASYLGSLFDGRVVFAEDGSFVTAELNARTTLGIAANEEVLGGFDQLFDASFSQTLQRLRAHNAVAQLRLRRTGEAVYVKLARASPSGRFAMPSSPATSEAAAPANLPAPSQPSAESLAQIELKAIREAVAATHGNLSAAAKQLGIGRATLYRKLKPRRG